MSKDGKAFIVIMLVLFGVNFCTPKQVERNNDRLDLEYTTTAVRG